jgi:hypothetical protein
MATDLKYEKLKVMFIYVFITSYGLMNALLKIKMLYILVEVSENINRNKLHT